MAENPYKPKLPVINPTRSFLYAEPVSYEPEDNETYSGKTTISNLTATSNQENPLSNLWNNTRCGNDDDFCMPIEDGDIIYNQIMINNPVVTPYVIKIYNGDGEEIPSGSAISTEVVRDKENGNNYLNIRIDTSLINCSCFHIGISYSKPCTPTEEGCVCTPGWENCALLPISMQQSCLMGHCSKQTTSYSDLYCKQDCLETLLVEGDYNDGYDCDGNFYGTPLGQTPKHVLKFRVPATIERREYNFTETVLNGKKIKSTQVESWLFRTEKIPPYVVEMLAKAFNSKQLTIEGVDYKRAIKLTKNFEEGRMWIVSETLVTDCDEINFACNS